MNLFDRLKGKKDSMAESSVINLYQPFEADQHVPQEYLFEGQACRVSYKLQAEFAHQFKTPKELGEGVIDEWHPIQPKKNDSDADKASNFMDLKRMYLMRDLHIRALHG